jgi:hypothetical protein
VYSNVLIPIAPHGGWHTRIDGVGLRGHARARNVAGPGRANSARHTRCDSGMTGRLGTGCARLSQICAALVLLGCQSNPRHVSVKETAAAAGSYLVCLHDTALALDDQVSPVSKIASAVANRCSSAFDAGTEALTRGMSPLTAVIFRDKAEHENFKLAALAVHEERQERKNGGRD